jgi:histidine ammonia-lyase
MDGNDVEPIVTRTKSNFEDRRMHTRSKCLFAVFLYAIAGAASADADLTIGYKPITPSQSGVTITLTGRDLTPDQVVAVARDGAKVQFSAEAKQRAADAYGLLLEGAREGVPIYAFNRGAGTSRAVTLEGDPESPENKAKLLERQTNSFNRGPAGGYGPEIAEEEMVRALMAVRANTLTYEAASPQLIQMLADMLNADVTPVTQSRGTAGESDISVMANIAGTMVGKGEAYLHGVRMPAAEALDKAGLKPIQPGAADDSALTSTNAYTVGLAALMVSDARKALDWADLALAIDLDGMNNNITPLSLATQANRPYKWLNWDAARLLDMMKGSYLFNTDPGRVIQDAESMRGSAIRDGAAWQAWANLRDTLVIQMNSSDHNPAVKVGLSPADSWELATPQMMTYYVKGGPANGGKHGYIVTNANWDPYPLANDIEAFTIALANMDTVVTQRIFRFESAVITGVKPSDVLKPEQLRQAAPQGGGFAVPPGLWQQIASDINPVAPTPVTVFEGADDMQAHMLIKVGHARDAVEATFDLLGEDLLTGTYWLDIRKAQDGARDFGPGPDAAWTAFRQIVPFQQAQADRPARPIGRIAYEFIKANAAAKFLPAGPVMPGEAEAKKSGKN